MDGGDNFSIFIVFGLPLAFVIFWYFFSNIKNKWGKLNPEVLFLHCQKRGFVATGLSRKEGHFQAHCKNCGITYDI